MLLIGPINLKCKLAYIKELLLAYKDLPKNAWAEFKVFKKSLKKGWWIGWRFPAHSCKNHF